MQLPVIVGPIYWEAANNIRVGCHMYLNKVCRHQSPKLICDGEGNEAVPSVVDKSFWWLEQCCSSNWFCACVSGGLRCRYTLRLVSSLVLTSTSPSMYTQPLGRGFIGRACWWLQYVSGIFIIFLGKSGKLSHQHCGFLMVNTKSGHDFS